MRLKFISLPLLASEANVNLNAFIYCVFVTKQSDWAWSWQNREKSTLLEGGIRIAEDKFLKEIRKITSQKDIL